jgi:hypothetical protein
METKPLFYAQAFTSDPYQIKPCSRTCIKIQSKPIFIKCYCQSNTIPTINSNIVKNNTKN